MGTGKRIHLSIPGAEVHLEVGVPEAVSSLTHAFEYNKLDSLKQVLERFPGEFGSCHYSVRAGVLSGISWHDVVVER